MHPAEIDLLRSLVSQMIELLSDGEPQSLTPADPLEHVLDLASPEPPSDPVLRRLFPDAYSDEEEAAADFRRYTERGLREGKRANAAVVLASLGGPGPAEPDATTRHTVRVSPEETEAWMRALTDLRLALGTRLGLEQDAEPAWIDEPDDPRRYVHGVYEWLGWLQDSLVRAVLRG